MKITGSTPFLRSFPSMSSIHLKRPLKVCSTCRHWTKRYKGFCDRLQQGVGKFHICSGWTEENVAQEAGKPQELPVAARAGKG